MKNHNRGFVLPLLIAIVALLLGGGGYYVANQSGMFAPNDAFPETATTTTAAKLPENEVVITQSGSIRVTSPRGGEAWKIGSSYTISWTNYSGKEPLTIALQATQPNGKASVKIIAQNLPVSSNGTYKWTVTPEDTNSKYKIEVYPAGGRELVGRSNGYFMLTGNEALYEIYTVHPGFVTPEAYAEFEKTKKTCVGRSEPIPGDSRIADGPSLAKCFGYLTPAYTASKPSCVRGGCSGQLCVEQATDGNGPMTTCEYRAEYACYRTATCERQSSGSCGWTQTPALTACISNPPPIQ